MQNIQVRVGPNGEFFRSVRAFEQQRGCRVVGGVSSQRLVEEGTSVCGKPCE